MSHLGSLVPPNCMFILRDDISTTTKPWREPVALNCENQQNFALSCENQQNFTSKIWLKSELGSAAMGHLGNLMDLKCMFMSGDHISSATNPWQVGNFTMRKSVEFRWKNLVQFGPRFGCHGCAALQCENRGSISN
jgi:hypothetical protein